MAIKHDPDSAVEMLTTELNSLASASGVISTTVFDNSGTDDRHLFVDGELVVTFASSPTAGQVVELYLVPAPDGTNYADGSATVRVVTTHVGAFPSRAVATAQRIPLPNIPVGPYKYKALLFNNTSQAFASSGNKLVLYPRRFA